MNTEFILSKLRTNKKYDVKQATVILYQYGISHNEKKTRDLIAKGKLVAKEKGNPGDRRSGYEIKESDIYDLVVSEIPIMKPIFEHFNTMDKPKAKPSRSKTIKKDSAVEEPKQ